MKSSQADDWEICILAGGLSSRMGRDKSRLRLGPRTLLAQIRDEAKLLGWPVRVIRRDVVPRCGPLGGVFTALKSTRARSVLFLACDMPWITAGLLRILLTRFGPTNLALFVRVHGKAGFPFALRREALAVVAGQIARKEFSLQALARVLKAKSLSVPIRLRAQLRNINTPLQWKEARCQWPSLAERGFRQNV
jgi:molybdopterin-guanine dinucleotide biosynthesis protein A